MAAHDVEVSRIEFELDGAAIVGLLRMPKREGPFPALAFLGPLTSVKEQVPGHYAEAMTRRGYVTLAIDNRHFGESGGQPRNYEHPGRKAEDIRAGLAFLAQRPEVDGERLGAVGICAGGGYMAKVAACEPLLRAFATVAGFMHDAAQQRQWMGERFDAALLRAQQARQRFEQAGVSDEIPAVGEGDVAMPLREAFDYYATPRGAHPNYQNAFAVMSREHTLTWDAQGLAPDIRVPTLMVHSDNALAPALARTFYDALGGPKHMVWMESQGQIDFYDDPAMIEPAADALAAHFDRYL